MSVPRHQTRCFRTKLFFSCATCSFFKTRFIGSNRSPLTIGPSVTLNRSVRKRFLNDCHEYIFHFTVDGKIDIDRLALGVPYQDKSNIARWSHTRGRDARCRGNTWFIPYQTIQSREKERPHPATFPVQLAEWCIKLHAISSVKTMLDPFLGIGNSAIAAKNCDVPKFIGFEIDKTYLAEARRRLQLK